ncbi:MAG TPA: hypothetical protein VKQ36_14000, partial [Ktedonobacterales bacterium]|nr:hypothetical protein [Ktedonobacterales bacterium]
TGSAGVSLTACADGVAESDPTDTTDGVVVVNCGCVAPMTVMPFLAVLVFPSGLESSSPNTAGACERRFTDQFVVV